MKEPLHNKLVRRLSEAFGKHRVIVNNEWHIQVECKQGKHDVWINSFDEIKFKLCKHKKTQQGSLKSIVKAMGQWDSAHTDVAKLEQIKQLSNFVGYASTYALDHDIKSGIFVDAGFKDGKAKIAVIMVEGTKITALGDTIEVNSSNQAELKAIWSAVKLRDEKNVDYTIFSDSQGAVQKLQQSVENLKWISRTKNKIADKLGNMRGQ